MSDMLPLLESLDGRLKSAHVILRTRDEITLTNWGP
jgi:hypothetical protein